MTAIVPPAACAAAHDAITCRIGEPGWAGKLKLSPHDLVDIALAAAAPFIAAAEREAIRQALTTLADEIDNIPSYLSVNDRIAVAETLRQVVTDLDKLVTR